MTTKAVKQGFKSKIKIVKVTFQREVKQQQLTLIFRVLHKHISVKIAFNEIILQLAGRLVENVGIKKSHLYFTTRR